GAVPIPGRRLIASRGFQGKSRADLLVGRDANGGENEQADESSAIFSSHWLHSLVLVPSLMFASSVVVVSHSHASRAGREVLPGLGPDERTRTIDSKPVGAARYQIKISFLLSPPPPDPFFPATRNRR